MTDAGGNDIAIPLHPDRLGEMFFLDREVSGGEGRPSLEGGESEDWGYAIRFASSFSEMVAGIKIGADHGMPTSVPIRNCLLGGCPLSSKR